MFTINTIGLQYKNLIYLLINSISKESLCSVNNQQCQVPLLNVSGLKVIFTGWTPTVILNC